MDDILARSDALFDPLAEALEEALGDEFTLLIKGLHPGAYPISVDLTPEGARLLLEHLRSHPEPVIGR